MQRGNAQNWKGIRKSFASGNSIWRSMLNEWVRTLEIDSPVLDVGSGNYGSSAYHMLIPGFDALQVYSIDIVSGKRPGIVANVEHGLPLRAGRVRTCLAFNIFEHLHDFHKALDEISSVLEPQGKIYIAVPFLLRVHADPGDFFRYTGQCLEQTLAQKGFSHIGVIPCGSGALTAALSQVDFLVPYPLRGPSLYLSVLLDKLLTKKSRGKFRNARDYPLGYFVEAEKAPVSHV